MIFQASLEGEELLNLFHSTIAGIAPGGGEELQYALWTNVTPYTSPGQVLGYCIIFPSSKTILRNLNIYFLIHCNIYVMFYRK